MDFTVQPRSLSMFRAEQMLALSGPIRLEGEGGKRRVVNGGELELRDAILIDASAEADKHASAGWERSRPGATVEIDGPASAAPPERFEFGPGPRREPVPDRAADQLGTREENQGEMRLVAWVTGTSGGQVIEPAVDRRRGFTAVLVHLQERSAA